MNRVTIEYECDGRQYMAVVNFESCSLSTDSDTVDVRGGKNNAKLMSFSTNQRLRIDLINPSNLSACSGPIEDEEKKEKEEEVEIDYIVVPEKPKKKRKRRKKRKFDNGRKTN